MQELEKQLCDYGCGQEAKFYFKQVKKWCCSKSKNSCLEMRRKNSESLKKVGAKLSIIRKKVFSNSVLREKLSNIQKKIQNEQSVKDKQSKSHKKSWKKHKVRIRYIESQIKSWKNKKRREDRRKYMLDGGASHAYSFVRNPSNPQVHIWKETIKIFSEVYLNPAFYHLEKQCNPDIVIPKLEIIIEYDGYRYHQDPGKDLERQKMLEEDGWKFIRYKGTKNKDYYPTKRQIWKDIKELLKEGGKES